jgi:hypothetical protein
VVNCIQASTEIADPRLPPFSDSQLSAQFPLPPARRDRRRPARQYRRHLPAITLRDIRVIANVCICHAVAAGRNGDDLGS